MPAILPLIIGAGVAFGAEELFHGMSKTQAPNQPNLPNQADANAKAAATIADQRAALLASGGQTDYTGGLGVLTGSDISKNTLTGL